MSDYAITFAPTFDRPPETMVGETVFDGEGNAIGWIVNAVDEPDEATMLKLHSRMNTVLLDMNEEMLTYHSWDRENASSKELIDCVIRAHQIIEDAAMAGVGTCTMEPDGYLDEEYGVYACSNCGYEWQFNHDGPKENGWTYCPKCRARIIEEVTE